MKFLKIFFLHYHLHKNFSLGLCSMTKSNMQTNQRQKGDSSPRLDLKSSAVKPGLTDFRLGYLPCQNAYKAA
jgi:hypothetical protein